MSEQERAMARLFADYRAGRTCFSCARPPTVTGSDRLRYCDEHAYIGELRLVRHAGLYPLADEVSAATWYPILRRGGLAALREYLARPVAEVAA